jgi:hypothetical protein
MANLKLAAMSDNVDIAFDDLLRKLALARARKAAQAS